MLIYLLNLFVQTDLLWLLFFRKTMCCYNTALQYLSYKKPENMCSDVVHHVNLLSIFRFCSSNLY